MTLGTAATLSSGQSDLYWFLINENMYLSPKIAALTDGNQKFKFTFRYVHL